MWLPHRTPQATADTNLYECLPRSAEAIISILFSTNCESAENYKGRSMKLYFAAVRYGGVEDDKAGAVSTTPYQPIYIYKYTTWRWIELTSFYRL